MKRKALRRGKYFLKLKIDRPSGIAFRRNCVDVKQGRAKYFAYEKKVFFMNVQRCRQAGHIHIIGIN